MVKIENFNLKYLFVFLLGFLVGLLIGYHPVYAADSDIIDRTHSVDISDSELSMTQFSTLNDLLEYTSSDFSSDFLHNKIESNDFSVLLLVSYYYGDWHDSGMDLYCLPDSVSVVPYTDSDGSFSFVFSGPVGSKIDYYSSSYIQYSYPDSPPASRSDIIVLDGDKYIVYDVNCGYSVRSVYDITDYHNFDDIIPNYFLKRSFKEVGFLNSFISSVNSFMGYIVLVVCLFILLYIINKKFDLGLDLKNNHYGGKPL